MAADASGNETRVQSASGMAFPWSTMRPASRARASTAGASGTNAPSASPRSTAAVSQAGISGTSPASARDSTSDGSTGERRPGVRRMWLRRFRLSHPANHGRKAPSARSSQKAATMAGLITFMRCR